MACLGTCEVPFFHKNKAVTSEEGSNPCTKLYLHITQLKQYFGNCISIFLRKSICSEPRVSIPVTTGLFTRLQINDRPTRHVTLALLVECRCSSYCTVEVKGELRFSSRTHVVNDSTDPAGSAQVGRAPALRLMALPSLNIFTKKLQKPTSSFLLLVVMAST